jgi:hypothetical protein
MLPHNSWSEAAWVQGRSGEPNRSRYGGGRSFPVARLIPSVTGVRPRRQPCMAKLPLISFGAGPASTRRHALCLEKPEVAIAELIAV